MKNTDVFKDFDMVVSITEKSINDQLLHLTRMGTINPELVIVEEFDEEADGFGYVPLNSVDEIKFDAKGNPLTATIAIEEMTPQVSITDSGKVITFILKFERGYVWLWKGTGPKARLTKYNASGWQYAVPVNMDLHQLKKESLEQGKDAAGRSIKVPDFVEEQLSSFMSNMFDVSHLFMDFQSTDLMRFAADKTQTGEAGSEGVKQLVLFMEFYLNWLAKKGNAFILGYSITQNDKTAVPDEAKVPDSLKPTGTTYTMFRDRQNPGLSTLNFALVTKGGFKQIRRSPDNFDTNWISPEDQCDGKMIYAASRFSEEFILKPLFEKFRDETYNQLKTGLTLGPKSSYEQAKKATDKGYSFNLSDWNIKSDIYNSNYDVVINNKREGNERVLVYDIKGRIFVYKGHTMDMGICTARASSEVTIDWEAKFIVKVEKDKSGKTTLKLQHEFKSTEKKSSDQNTCADMWKGLNSVLSFFSKIFDFIGNGLSVAAIPASNLGSIFSKMDDSFNNAFMLPAGGVFFFKDPTADNSGNLSLSLTYKTDSAVALKARKFLQKRQLLSSRRKVNLAAMGTVEQTEIDA